MGFPPPKKKSLPPPILSSFFSFSLLCSLSPATSLYSRPPSVSHYGLIATINLAQVLHSAGLIVGATCPEVGGNEYEESPPPPPPPPLSFLFPFSSFVFAPLSFFIPSDLCALAPVKPIRFVFHPLTLKPETVELFTGSSLGWHRCVSIRRTMMVQRSDS